MATTINGRIIAENWGNAENRKAFSVAMNNVTKVLAVRHGWQEGSLWKKILPKR